MELSNFELVSDAGGCVFAKVDVSTGCFLFRKTKRRLVGRFGGGYWRFIDTGEPIGHEEMEALLWENSHHKSSNRLTEEAVKLGLLK